MSEQCFEDLSEWPMHMCAHVPLQRPIPQLAKLMSSLCCHVQPISRLHKLRCHIALVFVSERTSHSSSCEGSGPAAQRAQVSSAPFQAGCTLGGVGAACPPCPSTRHQEEHEKSRSRHEMQRQNTKVTRAENKSDKNTYCKMRSNQMVDRRSLARVRVVLACGAPTHGHRRALVNLFIVEFGVKWLVRWILIPSILRLRERPEAAECNLTRDTGQRRSQK